MAVVDVLISKTFDASVICPAEQMLVVDDAIHDEVVAELERMGARVLSPDDVDALAAVAFDEDGRARMEALGRSCLDLGALAGSGWTSGQGPARAAARRPRGAGRAPARAREAHAGARRRALALGRPRDRRLRARHRARRPRPHVRDLRGRRRGHRALRPAHPHRAGARQRADGGGRAGRRLQPDDPDLLAGVRQWGGSTTTDNVNYRNLLNVKAVSRRQTPPQWFRVPSETYFGTGALENLRTMTAEHAVIVTDAASEELGVADEVRRHLSALDVRSSPGSSPSRPRPRSAPASRCSANRPRSSSSRSAGGR